MSLELIIISTVISTVALLEGAAIGYLLVEVRRLEADVKFLALALETHGFIRPDPPEPLPQGDGDPGPEPEAPEEDLLWSGEGAAWALAARERRNWR